MNPDVTVVVSITDDTSIRAAQHYVWLGRDTAIRCDSAHSVDRLIAQLVLYRLTMEQLAVVPA